MLVETAARLKGLGYLLGAYCIGIEATMRLRELLHRDRRTAVVAAVGSSFALGKGIDAGGIAGRTGQIQRFFTKISGVGGRSVLSAMRRAVVRGRKREWTG